MKKFPTKVLFLYFAYSVFSGVNFNSILFAQYIPTYHWSYEYLEQLKVRGYLNDINFSHRPFLIQDIQPDLQKLTPSHFVDNFLDRKSTRLNSSHTDISRMPSSA